MTYDRLLHLLLHLLIALLKFGTFERVLHFLLDRNPNLHRLHADFVLFNHARVLTKLLDRVIHGLSHREDLFFHSIDASKPLGRNLLLCLEHHLELILEVSEGPVLLGTLTLKRIVLLKNDPQFVLKVECFLVVLACVLADSTFKLRITFFSFFAEEHDLLMELCQLGYVLQCDLTSHFS